MSSLPQNWHMPCQARSKTALATKTKSQVTVPNEERQPAAIGTTVLTCRPSISEGINCYPNV